MSIGRVRCLVPVLSLALSACGGSSDSEQSFNLEAANNQPPSITLNGGTREQITVGSTYTDPGASASDAEDGDLSGSIQMQSTLDTGTAGTYTITYTVTDSAGASVSVVRTVEAVATAEPQNSEPQILLNGSAQVQVPQGGAYEEAGASATDTEDGDLTELIEISSTVDINSIGSYEVTYSVTDAHGASATVTRTVEVVQQVRTFVHPGLLHSEADFERIRNKIAEEDETWVNAWNTLAGDSASDLRNPNPLTELRRGGDGQNFGRLINELRFAYAYALYWKISGDPAYGDTAVNFLNAWSSTLQKISGNADRYLASGLYGYQWANVAEIMRTYDGWEEEGREQVKSMLLDIFLPMNQRFLTEHNDACISNYWANWDLANLASMMAIGVFTDRPDIYENALNYLYHGRGSGALDNLMYFRHPGNMGQYQESGRDQGHTTLGVALYGTIAKMAWNQGDDLFAYNNHALLATSEYIARYNLFEEVPFTFYGPNCGSSRYGQSVVSEKARGSIRPAWELIYNHYQNKLGIAAPWTERMLEQKTRFERYDNGGDGMGWGSLTEILDPIDPGGAPRGLYAELRGESVVLSWWGAAGADNYLLQRADSAGATYTTIATVGASEVLTYTDTDVLREQGYRYRVLAVSEVGESAPSNVIEVHVGPKLLVHYTFDEVGAEQVTSAAGEANTATLHGNPESTPGKVGNAIAFDGVDDYVSLPEGIASKLADFSIASWIYRDEDTNLTRLFDFGDDDQRYMFFAPREGGQSCFRITKVSYHGDRSICANTVPAGQWVHVTLTLEDNTGILYINGEEAARNEGIDLTPMQIGASTKQNWLGRSQYSGDPLLAGRIDEFRIYSGALSAEEVAALAAE
ncbi:immunoglobulin-like domain-containing protein [Microbulbifer sp.]|uniref:immunoglobulin-like domain-containing protein n=1 Tax=Microbulbifer sp. TaxID=1908541 RepID=UPI003F2FDBEE